MGGAKRYLSIAVNGADGFREGLNPSYALDDSIKAAARYTTKNLICRRSSARPAIPDASAHIVGPHTAQRRGP